jgi:molybdopterin-guanine dinucleotide biosynthesis protein B
MSAGNRFTARRRPMAERELIRDAPRPKVIGLSGWSGSGKTTLLVKLIPLLAGRGLRIATLKHAHHAFDVDHPGKDSYEHRKAGASEIIVSSARRWAQIH